MIGRQNTFGDLKLFHYGVILADPPWLFANRSTKGEGKNPNQHYPCMKTEDIAALPVNHLAAPDCALFMWATSPMLPQQLGVLGAWGFTYKALGSWGKLSKTGEKLAFGGGYILRSAAEFYIVATRGAPKRKSRSIRNLILAPVREHSRKPDQMHSDIEALYDGPYVELFARAPRAGWSTWGLERDKFSAQADADHPIGNSAKLGGRSVPLQVVTPPTKHSDVACDIALGGSEAVNGR